MPAKWNASDSRFVFAKLFVQSSSHPSSHTHTSTCSGVPWSAFAEAAGKERSMVDEGSSVNSPVSSLYWQQFDEFSGVNVTVEPSERELSSTSPADSLNVLYRHCGLCACVNSKIYCDTTGCPCPGACTAKPTRSAVDIGFSASKSS